MADDDLIVRAQLRDELSAGLRNIRSELARTAAAAEGLGVTSTGKAGAGLDDLSNRGRRTSGALRELDAGLRSASRTAESVFVTGIRRGATVLGLLTGATAAFGLKSASNFQQSRIAFDTLLGSVDKGNQLFATLQQLNLKTPFELNDIAPATQLLLRYGVAADQVVPVIKSLLDAASLTTDPAANLQALALATGQIVSTGHLMGQDARQLTQAGIPAYQLFAEKLGITAAQAQKLGEAGKLSSDVFLEGLINMEGPLAKLQGGAEKLSGTLMGQISNLKDAVRVRLADAASPLTEQLTQQIQPITDLVGSAVDQLGPPVFQLIGFLVDGLQKGLPIVAPLLALIVTGLGRLLTAAGPALTALEPLGGRIGEAITQMFDQLVPVMPDVVSLLIAMVGVLPDFIQLLTDLIPIVHPIVQLVTAMLGFEPVRKVVSLLLVGLLAYNRLSALVGGLRAFATAVGFIGTNAEVAGAKANIAWGQFAALAAVAAGGAGVATGLPGATNGQSLGSDAAFVGSAALLGAGIGTLIPIPGVSTAAGAGVGAVLGLGFVGARRISEAIGDPVVPGATMNRHMAAGGGAAGLRITSGMRNFGLRSGASGHLSGSAVDVAGPGLSSYVQRVRAQGGWAALEGAGKGMHAHAEFGDPARPGGRSAQTAAVGGYGDVHVHIGQVIGQVDYDRGLYKALERVERMRRERAYNPIEGRAVAG